NRWDAILTSNEEAIGRLNGPCGHANANVSRTELRLYSICQVEHFFGIARSRKHNRLHMSLIRRSSRRSMARRKRLTASLVFARPRTVRARRARDACAGSTQAPGE